MDNIQLHVKTVIGNGSAYDGIMLIPLLAQWYIPHQCIWNLKDECNDPLRRIYVLDTPIPLEGRGDCKAIAVCEKHHQVFESKTGTPNTELEKVE